MNYWLGYFLILLVGSAGLIALLVLLLRAKSTRLAGTPGVILMILSLFITLMGLEFYLKVFFARPDSVPTLARANWLAWYHPPEEYNSLGYVDVEWTDQMVAGKIKVMVVGDSFVEGLTLKNIKDRFSNLLGQKLGADYVVFNLGKGGANTKDEIEAILDYPHAPDILVFSYFINDIEGVEAWQRGLVRPPRMEVSPYLLPLVRNSYAFNFFFWEMVRFNWFQQPDLKTDAKSQWFLDLYKQPDVWWLHQQKLLSIYEGAKSENIPLVVIVFPSLTYIEESKVATDRVVNTFRERGVPTIDVGELARGIPTQQLVASSVDVHPGELVNRLVAEALYDKFVEIGLVKKQE